MAIRGRFILVVLSLFALFFILSVAAGEESRKVGMGQKGVEGIWYSFCGWS